MIDIENSIFTPIAQAVREQFSGANVTGEYISEPSSFPHVSIVEADNYVSNGHRDTSTTEKYGTLMYEVSVFSNKAGVKKSEARAILAFIDGMMSGLNFTRIAMTPVPNYRNNNIYRLVARYRAETDGTNMYRI